MMRRLDALIVLAVLLGASWTGCAPRRPEEALPAEGPNIILIVVDTLRADHLGVYGYSRDTSPNIDAFAYDALLFRRAYTPRPMTTPAMASLFTSSPPHVHGVRTIPQSLPEEVRFLPEFLRDNGYATAAVVANPAVGRDFGFSRGFDLWQQLDDERGCVTDAALAALDTFEKGDRPFFLWVHYMKPHAPYQPSREYRSMFHGDALWGEGEVPFGEGEYAAYRTLPQVLNLDGETNPYHYTAEYDAEIRDVDHEVGRFIDDLRARGLHASSLVALTADHGESLGEHDYYFSHGMFPYDVNGRVPLVIRHPERPPGVTDVPASLVDLLPTLMKAAGLPVPPEAMGADLFAAVDANDTERLVFAESGYEDPPQISVRSESWKLIYIPAEADRKRLEGGRYELYNTEEDPLEEHNLAGRGLEVETTLARALAKWLATWKDYDPPGAQSADVPQETLDELRALGYVQ